MKKIRKVVWLAPEVSRVPVADAVRLLASTSDNGHFDVYEASDGTFELRARDYMPTARQMKEQLVEFFAKAGVMPTSPFDRWGSSYTGEGLQDGLYEIGIEDLRRFAEPFEIGIDHSDFGWRPHAGVEPTAPVTAEPAPTDKGASPPLPLSTGDVAFCFDGLRYQEKQWKKPLGDRPKWLDSCVAIPGRRGVSETRWNPVLIGAALVLRGHVPARSVRARFQTQPMLRPWLDAWKTYEADHIESA